MFFYIDIIALFNNTCYVTATFTVYFSEYLVYCHPLMPFPHFFPLPTGNKPAKAGPVTNPCYTILEMKKKLAVLFV
jgi:hypothetical protein